MSSNMKKNSNLPTFSRHIIAVFIILLVVEVISKVVLVVEASEGDQLPEFEACVSSCSLNRCSFTSDSNGGDKTDLPFALRLLSWSCDDNCKYECMHKVTSIALETDNVIYQFYGKWPFYRIFGLQEPASVLFSLLNLFVHCHHLPLFINNINKKYYMKKFYIIFSLININSWMWSTIYHSRDLTWTEQLDYYSACLSIFYSTYYTILRVFQIHSTKYTIIITLIFLIGYLYHIFYMHFIDFDYQYNVIVNVIVGMLSNLLWVGWSLNHWYKRPDNAWKPLFGVIMISAAMSLEVFDFPPWYGIFDAHSIWHASTVPLMIFWYKFLLEDAKIESFRESKGKRKIYK